MESPDSLSLRRRLVRVWDATRLWLILALGVVGTVAGISVGTLQDGSALILSVGDVSPQDLLAPFGLTYESQVLTEESRSAAESAVAEVYDPPSSAIARQQLERLKAALEAIAAIRADDSSTPQQRREAVLGLSEIQLTPETAQAILILPP